MRSFPRVASCVHVYHHRGTSTHKTTRPKRQDTRALHAKRLVGMSSTGMIRPLNISINVGKTAQNNRKGLSVVPQGDTLENLGGGALHRVVLADVAQLKTAAVGGGKPLLEVSRELSWYPQGVPTWGVNPLANHGTSPQGARAVIGYTSYCHPPRSKSSKDSTWRRRD